MGATPSDYDAVIADLEGQILELQGTVETLKRMRDKGTVTEAVTAAGAPRAPSREMVRRVDTTPVEFPDDFFLKMSLPEAVKAYLSMVKRKQSTKQLVDALERGGYPHRSKNFYTTVFGVLNRHWKTQGEIVKVDGEWGLREWYKGLPGEKKAAWQAAEGRLRKLFPGATLEGETKDEAPE